MLQQLDIVAHSLNIMQSDSSNLCNAMESWLTLSSSPILCDSLKEAVKEKMKKAITPHHILAKMVSNKVGCELPLELKSMGMDFAEELDSEFPGILAAWEVQDETVFPSSAFKESVRNILDPLKYWRFIGNNTAMEPLKRFCNMALRVLSCPPSSAGATNVLFIFLGKSFKHIYHLKGNAYDFMLKHQKTPFSYRFRAQLQCLWSSSYQTPQQIEQRSGHEVGKNLLPSPRQS